MDKRPVAVREMGDELVILDTRSNQIHQLNKTAAFVWKEARIGANPEAISTGLFAEFDVENLSQNRFGIIVIEASCTKPRKLLA